MADTPKSRKNSDSILKPALEIGRMGAALIRLWPKSKRAIEPGWSSAPALNCDEFVQKRQVNENIGVRLGVPSKTQFGFLAALDFDVKKPEAESEARDALVRYCPNYEELPRVGTGSGGAQATSICSHPLHWRHGLL